MPTHIDNFESPDYFNALDCMTSSRYLNSVNEVLEITSVCQDPNNIGLVVIDFTLVGTFLYTPRLELLSVDGDTSYETNGILVPLDINNLKNSTIPINTNCQVFNGRLVYDFGRVIPNYTTCQSISFRLIMTGSIPLSFGTTIPPQNPFTNFTWTKGVLPKPIGIEYTSQGYLNVIFGYEGSVDCSCNLTCIAPSGVSHDLSFCPGDTQVVTFLNDSSNTDPYSILIKLADTLGNESVIDFNTYVFTKPKRLGLNLGTKPKRIEVLLDRKSEGNVDIPTNAYYQIIKFHGTSQNTQIWKDWSNLSWSYFVDYDIIPGETYGYAVRFKGDFNDISLLSEWAIVKA